MLHSRSPRSAARFDLPEALEGRRLFSAGDLDPGFSGDGLNTFAPGGYFQVAAVDHRNNRTVVLGADTSGSPTAGAGANLLALNASGNLDKAFSSDGIRPIPRLTNPADVLVQPDGKILVVGVVDGVAGVARVLANGAADTSFSGDGFATFPQFSAATGVALTASGRVVVSGYWVRNQGDNADGTYAAAGRLLANGAADAQFSGDGAVLGDYGRFNAVAVQADGKVVLVGTTGSRLTGGPDVTVGTDVVVARLTTGGSLDASFGQGGFASYDYGYRLDVTPDDRGTAVDLAPDGKILVGATFSGIRPGLLRFTTAGRLDLEADLSANQSTPADVRVYDVKSSFDGSQVYVAYDFVHQDYPIPGIVRVDADGTRDYTFGETPYGDGEVQLGYSGVRIDLTGDGKLVAVANPPGLYDGAAIDRVVAARYLTATVAADRVRAPDGTVAYVEGTNGSDTIRATRLADGRYQVTLNATTRTFPKTLLKLVIHGGGGNDNINTAASGLPAFADGGPGDDYINLGTPAVTTDPDTGLPAPGQVLVGGFGNDTLRGGALADQLFGDTANAGGFAYPGRIEQPNDGNDLLNGDAGDDLLVGGYGRDSLYGFAGDDTLYNAYADLDAGEDLVPDYLDGGDGLDESVANGAGDALTSVETVR